MVITVISCAALVTWATRPIDQARERVPWPWAPARRKKVPPLGSAPSCHCCCSLALLGSLPSRLVLVSHRPHPSYSLHRLVGRGRDQLLQVVAAMVQLSHLLLLGIVKEHERQKGRPLR